MSHSNPYFTNAIEAINSIKETASDCAHDLHKGNSTAGCTGVYLLVHEAMEVNDKVTSYLQSPEASAVTHFQILFESFLLDMDTACDLARRAVHKCARVTALNNFRAAIKTINALETAVRASGDIARGNYQTAGIPFILNVGALVSDRYYGMEQPTLYRIEALLTERGVKVKSSGIAYPTNPGEEKTYVVECEADDGMDQDSISRTIGGIAPLLGQDCIAVYYNQDCGELVGEYAHVWGPFESKYFKGAMDCIEHSI